MAVQVNKSFKPCYKWNTFNTNINSFVKLSSYSFKPCYKWNTFNTSRQEMMERLAMVLNLVISGIPSIPCMNEGLIKNFVDVLNLVISGIPSIPQITLWVSLNLKKF